jgi:nickel/cobalt exporter
MFSLIAGTFILAFIHALIPNHWLPLVAVARAEHWKIRDLNLVTVIAASSHVIGTVLLGVVLGLIGVKLESQYGNIIHVVAPILLITFGLVYYTVNLPHHHHHTKKDVADYKRSKRKWIIIFIIMMFLSPCLEVESLFLSAGAYGMATVTIMSVIYTIVSISGILLLVNLGNKGVSLLPAEFIEHNEKKISGGVLILVGIVSFFLH